DLYALGVILYEMLSGKLPFRADDLVVLITRHIMETPPPLSEAIPLPVRELVFELLAKKPEERVQTAVELVRRIDRLLADTSIAPPGTIPPSGFPSGKVASTRPAPGSGLRSRLDLAVSRARTLGLELVRRAPILERRVSFGRFALPLGGLVAGGAGLAVIGALGAVLILSGGDESRSGSPATDASGSIALEKRDGEAERRKKLVERASAGDAPALAALEALPQKERTIDEARALGRGRCAQGEIATCLEAYRSGVLAFPRLGREPGLLADVRRAMDDERASESAFRLAAHHLGAPGLDAIWDHWAATRGKQDAAVTARRTRARAFLDDGAVREHASRELRLVFELERAETRKRCGEAKAALAKAIEYGDERLAPVLERLGTTRGCGFMSLGDCWGCLRSGKELAEARARVKERKAPAFTGQ
ncbi:MAG TPA: hypothetical protein VGK73_25165, partial [Polyangiaceae bacterium]